MSRQELAEAVNAYLYDHAELVVHLDGNYVGKLERGVHRWPSAEYRKAFRAVLGAGTDPELGFFVTRGCDHRGSDAARVGLRWGPTASQAVDEAADLWTADAQNSPVRASAWTAAVLSGPTRDWLLNRREDVRRHGGSRAGAADVEALWSMCRSFADADHRLGGGYARSTLLHFVSDVAIPLLQGGYDDAVGRGLFAATARLCDLAGFMAFDSGMHGLAQRYYIQALRMAQASGHRSLGAHVLSDMAMQAHHLGQAAEALTLAYAGQRTARECGSASTLARCLAMEARAHASRGDRQACAAAMRAAEVALGHARIDEEPFWIRFFNEAQLFAEFMYAAHDLGSSQEVQSLAPTVVLASPGMHRRRVLATTTLAMSYLSPGDRGAGVQLERACETIRQVLPTAARLRSVRTHASLNSLRRALGPYAARDEVAELDRDVVAAVRGAV